jgi:serine/threonine protein phosphatase 1
MSFVTYAIGDIHGCMDKLRRLVKRCQSDAGDQIKFVFLGDYIDRGPDSRAVVEYVIELQSRMTRVVCLLGNHENLALAALHGSLDEAQWLFNGGGATLRSYGITAAAEMPNEHIAWMKSLPTHHDDGRRFFVHAGVNPSRPLDAQDDHDLIWIREPFLYSNKDYGRLIVHGHTPVRAVEVRPNRVNIDTAAVLGGPLTAAAFNDLMTRPIKFLQET